MLYRLTAFVLVGLSLLTLAACDSGGSADDGTVAGVDVEALLAPPQPTDLQAARQVWQQRGVPPATPIDTAGTFQLTLDGTVMNGRVVSFDAGQGQQYGAIVEPEDDLAPGEMRPIVALLHDGTDGVDVEALLEQIEPFGPERDRYTYVIPAFRSEPLRAGGRTFPSRGVPSPLDLSVDDALALTRIAQRSIVADDVPVAFVGFGRGATVALLAGIRTELVDAVVAVSSLTGLVEPSMQPLIEQALEGRTLDVPGFDALEAQVFAPLVEGDLPLAEARRALIRRSPLYFAEDLPAVQLHHGTANEVVPVEQTTALEEALTSAGRTPSETGDTQVLLYEGARRLDLLDPVLENIGGFLEEQLLDE